MSGGQVDFRILTTDDIPAALELKRQAGWNHVADDWRFFLRSDPRGCFGAVREGRLVGTACNVTYGKQLGWVGLVLVDPGCRRMGIATELMNRSIEYLAGVSIAGLDATPMGQPVYERLGFKGTRIFKRMLLKSAPRLRGPQKPVLPITSDQIAVAVKMDSASSGADRTALLADLCRRAPHMAWQLRDYDRVKAVCLGRPGENSTYIGPVYAESADDAIAVTEAALQGLRDRPVALDVQISQEEYVAWLRKTGFTESRQFTRMYLRGEQAPSGFTTCYTIAGAEFG